MSRKKEVWYRICAVCALVGTALLCANTASHSATVGLTQLFELAMILLFCCSAVIINRRERITCGIFALCAFIVAACMFGCWVPISTVTDKIPLDELDEVYREHFRQEMQWSEAEGKQAATGDAYCVTRRTLFGRTRTTVCVPFVQAEFPDIGTANSTDWQVELEVFTMRREDDAAYEGWYEEWYGILELKETELDLAADENTHLVSTDLAENGSSISLTDKQMDHTDNGGYVVCITAATLDSTVEPNQDCSVLLGWSAGAVMKDGLFPAERISIVQSAELIYRNNLRS